MVQTVEVDSLTQFTEAVSTIPDDPDEEPPLDTDGMVELWDIWTEHVDSGANNDYLVHVPQWFASNEFGKRRPFFFAYSEFDDSAKGAILWGGVEMVDISIVENGAFERVDLDHVREELDISDDDDYIDEAGKIWIPRSLMTVFEYDA